MSNENNQIEKDDFSDYEFDPALEKKWRLLFGRLFFFQLRNERNGFFSRFYYILGVATL